MALKSQKGALGRVFFLASGCPGSTMRYKVYVVLSTGNEKGSNAVAVTHPL